MKLKMSDVTLATAATVYHTFYKTNKLKDFDPHVKS